MDERAHSSNGSRKILVGQHYLKHDHVSYFSCHCFLWFLVVFRKTFDQICLFRLNFILSGCILFPIYSFLPWLGEIGNRNLKETEGSFLVCINSDEVTADFNMGSVRIQTFPDSQTGKLLWLETPVVMKIYVCTDVYVHVPLTKKNR